MTLGNEREIARAILVALLSVALIFNGAVYGAGRAIGLW